jgi:predicted N-acetyltransferase YhbS
VNIQTLSREQIIASIPELCAVWNAAFGADWPLSQRLLRQTVEDDDLFESEGVFIARDGDKIIGWILSKTNRNGGPEIGRFAGRGGIGAWCVLPSHQKRGVGTALLEHAERFLRAANVAPNTLYFPHHLLPGVPLQCEAALRLLEARGYTVKEEHFDLQRDLTNWQMPEKARAAIEQNSTVEFRPAREDEREVLCDFVGREFPGPWTYSTRGHFARGGAAHDFVVAVEEGEILGFCHIGDWNSARLIPSTYWFPLLGERFGGLGPIGIAKEQRKRGLGLAICGAAVDELVARGATAMAIDWTTLEDFYGQLGFAVWKRYRQYEGNK